ncbi:MAG: hypothetical protein LC802_22350 [Acidobacteria bacterium]|nr:hypothetical protein [Acidobacteriota bacterium]
MADEGQIKRLNYFKHQFLKVEDFVLEQNYHVGMRRRHNRHLHTWGVAGDGLKVTNAQGATEVRVSKGLAVDSEGREIILPEEKVLPLSGFDPNTPVYVVISYTEKKTEPSNETGAEGDRRVMEEANLRAVTEKPSGDAGTNILLAKVNRNATKVVTTIDETDRRAAGVEAGELTVRRLTLRPAGDTIDISLWPRLSCSGANQAALENSSLKLDTGREIAFADNGQIRSFDASHRLVFNRANNRMEFYEFGDIVLLTGGANPAERLKVGQTGNVGIGRTAASDKLEVQGNVRATGLSFIDVSGTPYQDNILGITTGLEGTTKWLLVGGITDAGARRIALMGDKIHASGRIGIGTTDPKYLLSFANTLGDKISLWGSGEAHYGFGIQSGLLQIHTDGAGSDVAFGFGSSAGFTETARVKGNGRVGIGTSAPLTQLHIRKDAAGALGPVLTLMNGAGNTNAAVAIDLHTYDPGANNPPSARLQWLDDGNFSNHISFQTKAGGAPANALVERLRITNSGDLVLSANGRVRSPMWRAFQLATALPGGLPKSINFTTNGGLVILFVSGSGWAPNGGLIGMSVKVDGALKGNMRAFTNEPGSHKSFVPGQLVLALDAGQHTLLLEALPGTASDLNDFYNVTAVEMPISAEGLGFIFTGINLGGIVINQ